MIAFEATDFAVSGKPDDRIYRTMATEQYTLVDPKPGQAAARRHLRASCAASWAGRSCCAARWASSVRASATAMDALGAGAVRP
ncbi:MAG: hypothetical protein U0802_21610 [Candidatus Binatia bacterium]